MPSYLTRSGQPQWIGTEPFTREQRNAAGQAIEDRLLVAGIGLRAARPAPSFERQEYHATDTGELFRTREISGAPGTFEWRLMNPATDTSTLLPKAGGTITGDLVVQGKTTHGDAGTDLVENVALVQRIDTRSTTNTYTGDKLTQVVEKQGGTTVKTTVLNYSGDRLATTVETVGGRTITTTLNYDGNGVLTGSTRAVA